MTATCVDFVGSICKHVSSVTRHYIDYGPRLVGNLSAVTVSSATATCTADAALVIGTPAVVSTQTVVPTLQWGRRLSATERAGLATPMQTVVYDWICEWYALTIMGVCQFWNL